jgi:hypothetical protein
LLLVVVADMVVMLIQAVEEQVVFEQTLLVKHLVEIHQLKLQKQHLQDLTLSLLVLEELNLLVAVVLDHCKVMTDLIHQ